MPRASAFLSIFPLLLISSLAPHDGNAFGIDVHKEITKESLKSSSLATSIDSGLPALQFSNRAAEEIAAANAGVDIVTIGGIVPGSARKHFDDNKLKDGSDRLLELRSAIIRHLEAAEREQLNSVPALAARQTLGAAHHAIQDFYAHSTWVDSNKPGIEKLWWLQGENRNPFIAGSAAQCSCGTFIDTNAAPEDAPVVSGYFRAAPALMLGDALQGRCIHGSPTIIPVQDVAFNLQSVCEPLLPLDYPSLPGINKDKPGRIFPEAPLFVAARTKAVMASAAFTQGLILEVQARKWNRALCAFLGYSDSRGCNGKYGPFEFEQVLPFFRDGGVDRTVEAFTFEVPLFPESFGQLESISSEWSVEFSGTGTCPDDPGSIVASANQCHFFRNFSRFGISSPDSDAEWSWLTCDTGFDDQGRYDICGLNGLLPMSFDYLEWPGGSQSFQDSYGPEKKRAIVRSSNRCVLCTDGSGPSTVQIDGAFLSRLLPSLGIDNGPGAEPSSIPGTEHHVMMDGHIIVRLKVTYEYTKLPEAQINATALRSVDE